MVPAEADRKDKVYLWNEAATQDKAVSIQFIFVSKSNNIFVNELICYFVYPSFHSSVQSLFDLCIFLSVHKFARFI